MEDNSTKNNDPINTDFNAEGSQLEWESCFKCSPYPVIKFNSSGIITAFNDVAGELFELDDGELTSVNEIFPGPDKVFFTNHIADEKTSSFDYEIKGCYYNLTIKGLRDIQQAIIFFNDISKHIHIKKELLKSEERYRKLSELSFEGIIFHSNYMILDCNVAFRKLCGFNRDSLINKNFLNLLIPEYYHQAFIHNLESDYVTPQRINMIKADSRIIEVEIESRKIKQDGTEFYVTAFRDISENIKFEKITHVNYNISKKVNSQAPINIVYETIHHNLSKLIDTTNFFIALYNEDNDLIEFPYFVDEKDTKTKIENASTSQSLTFDVIQRGKPMLLNENEIKKIYEDINRRKWGTICKTWLGVPLKNYDKVFGVFGIQKYRDNKSFTEQDIKIMESVSDQISIAIHKKQTDELLALNERKFRTMFENIEDVYYEISLDGKILTLSPSYEKISQFDYHELIGKPISDIYANPEDRTKILSMLHNKDSITDYEILLKNKDGSTVPCSITAKIIHDEKNNPQKICGTLRDISIRKKAETALIESEKKLKEANETKDKFFSIIAHDLRAPFSGFLLLTETLNKELDDLDTDEILEIADTLNKSANQIYKLLINLLEWSKIQRGIIELKPVKLDIYVIVSDIVHMLNNQLETKGISFNNLIPQKTYVFADYNMINTVIRNLLNNSIKFCNKGGAITISSEMDEPLVKIIVEDDGIGMNNDILDKLFQIDANVSRLGTAEEKGSGLGLILCKEFIELNKGTIEIWSKPGKGTKISLTIPAKESNKNN